MSNYAPGSVPDSIPDIKEMLQRELNKISQSVDDASQSVLYRTIPVTNDSLSVGISANWKIAFGNVVRLSTSSTHTLTGIAFKTPQREIVLINTGTGVISMKSAGTESSASFRFLLSANHQLSANAAITLWYDQFSSRWRAISKA